MTKEEILNNEIKDEPFYLSENLEPHIYKAMEIYAKQYRQEQVTLGLPSVSQQRELLIAFIESHHEKHHYSYPVSEIDVNEYLSNL